MKKIALSSLVALSLSATVFFLAGCASDHDHSQHVHGAAGAKVYSLKTCLVTGDPFDHDKPYTFVYEGQEVQLCCKDCKAEFDKDPAKYLSKLKETK